MTAFTKFGFAALLAAVLFFTPLGSCAQPVQLTGSPAHPCCPTKQAPIPGDCARPGCIYMDTHSAPTFPIKPDSTAPVATLPALIVLAAPATEPVHAAESPRPPLRRFVALRQFRL